MDRKNGYQCPLEVLGETVNICVRSVPEILDFWLRPGSVIEHVRDGKADNQLGLTYGVAGAIEGMKICGYSELIRLAAKFVSS